MTSIPSPSRRHFLAACAALAAGRCLPALAGASGGRGAWIAGPASGISALLGPLAAAGGGAPFLWRNIDELKAGLASGRLQGTLLPTYVAAGLANRGLDLRLISVVTRGYLTLLAPAPLGGIEALAGRRVGFFLRHDLPDLMFSVMARKAGLDPARDVQAVYTSGGLEAVQMLLTGRLDAALVVEPLATAALAQARAAGRPLVRALDLKGAWQRATGQAGGYPQVGYALAPAHLDQAPRFQAALRDAVHLAAKDPSKLLQSAPGGLGVPPAVLQAALPWMNLDYQSGQSARGSLEAFFRPLLESHPSLLGGRLPGAAFYHP